MVQPDLSVTKITIEASDEEVKRLEDAIEQVKIQLCSIREHAEKRIGAEEAAVFDAHLLILEDPELMTAIKEKIQTDQVNAEYAIKETTDEFIAMFNAMENEYMRERASDIQDVTQRLLAVLLDVTIPNPNLITEEVIIVAEDLTPSDTAQLNRDYVKGFATDIGGRTSHSAIMARSLEIPAVVDTQTVTETIKHGDLLMGSINLRWHTWQSVYESVRRITGQLSEETG